MSKLSFKRRIASNFIVATAFIVAVVFVAVYVTVYITVYNRLDSDLTYEAEKHLKEVEANGDQLKFYDLKKLEEEEHKEVQVNPVFIQLYNADGSASDKSPNLKGDQLSFYQSRTNEHYTTVLLQKQIRQLQIPYIKDGKVNGYIITAMSLESTLIVLDNLLYTLLISYPIVLIGLFFISYMLAARSIVPVVNLTDTTHRITQNNLSERVELPANDDELHQLVLSINDLLDRIQGAIEREKQFTSDASHELRTPLSILQGTLEVLIRKPREPQEYQEKINLCLKEITRMNEIIDQLLEMARFEQKPTLSEKNAISILEIVNQMVVRRGLQLSERDLEVVIESEEKILGSMVPGFYANLILDNLLSNAIKYSNPSGKIWIKLKQGDEGVICTVEDEGMGILKEDVDKIFQPFFRSEALQHKKIKGVGLGLSIVRKAADAIQARVNVQSVKGNGTRFDVEFKTILRNH